MQVAFGSGRKDEKIKEPIERLIHMLDEEKQYTRAA